MQLQSLLQNLKVNSLRFVHQHTITPIFTWTTLKIRFFNVCTWGMCSGYSFMNSCVKNACWYLLMPPWTFASIIPWRRIVNGFRLRFGSCVYVDISWRSSFSTICIVSQAYLTGGTSSNDLLTTSNQGSIPGRELSVSKICLSIHNVWNSKFTFNGKYATRN